METVEVEIEIESSREIEHVRSRLEDIRKQIKRVRHLLDSTHTTDTLTKLWNNYMGLVELELKIMLEYKI